MIACTRRLITLVRVRNPQHYRLPKFFSSTMSGSPQLQPQKRILLAEDYENLSKKPRLGEETTPQAESSSLPPCLEANPYDDANNTITGVPVVDMRMAVVVDGGGGEEDQMQTEKVNNRPSSLEHGVEGNQSKGKKKKIHPPRVGRRSRNEEDEERRRKGTLLLPTTTGEMEPKALRLPKRQCALLLGFCGSGYRGMQM